MNPSSRTTKTALLAAGDILALGAVTLIGFLFHGELATAGLQRILAMFIPSLVGWFMAAPFLGAYDLERIGEPRELWRPAWAMLLGGPVATTLRGLWLNAPVIPIFIVVTSLIGALGMLIWRAIVLVLVRRSPKEMKGSQWTKPA
jgi:hypothetical protein